MQTPRLTNPSPLAGQARILVATDLTDLEFLLPHALEQAKMSGARVTLVHAVPASYLVPADPAAMPYVDGAQILQHSQALMLGTAKQLEAGGVGCDVVCRAGDPLSLVQQELNQRGASLVMMATHGRGKLGQLALGSVAHELVSKLEVPVLVIGPQAHNASHASPRKILHPVSLTGDYRESVALAIELAQEWKAELTLLYVFHDDIQQQADPGRRVEWARTALSDLLPEDMYLAAPVHAMAAFGKIPEQILKAATEIKADWIVMGVNPHTQPWSLKEDAAYKVIAAAGCPVLTLRHGTKTLPEGTIATAEWSERSAQLLVNAGIG